MIPIVFNNLLIQFLFLSNNTLHLVTIPHLKSLQLCFILLGYCPHFWSTQWNGSDVCGNHIFLFHGSIFRLQQDNRQELLGHIMRRDELEKIKANWTSLRQRLAQREFASWIGDVIWKTASDWTGQSLRQQIMGSIWFRSRMTITAHRYLYKCSSLLP